MLSCSVVSYSLWPHGLQPSRLLCLRDAPSKNTRVGCHFLLQGIFPTQGSNVRLLCLLRWQADSEHSFWHWNRERFMMDFLIPFPKRWGSGSQIVLCFQIMMTTSNSICRLHELVFLQGGWSWGFVTWPNSNGFPIGRHAQHHWSVCPLLVCIGTLLNLHQLKNAWFGYWRIIKECKSPRASKNDIWLEWWLKHEDGISIWTVWLIYKIIRTSLQEEWHWVNVCTCLVTLNKSDKSNFK